MKLLKGSQWPLWLRPRGHADVKTKGKALISRKEAETKTQARGLPGGPSMKSTPCNAGAVGLIPGEGTKIHVAAGQLSPLATTREARRRTEDPAQPKKKITGSDKKKNAR